MAAVADPESAMIQLQNEVSLNSFVVGSSTLVDVTHIESPGHFYVRPKVYSTYLSHLETPDLTATTAGCSTIVFKSKTVNRYVRGVISKSEDNEHSFCSILAIDYGFVENNVPSRKLYKPKNVASIPPMAQNCKLAECLSLTNEWSEDSISAMKTYVGTEPAIMTVKQVEHDKLIVQLKNSHGDIGTLMLLTDFAFLGLN